MVRVFIFIIFSSRFLYGQNDSKQYFVQNPKLSSSESRIEVRGNGDTVLVSIYKNSNLGQNSLTQLEFVYKGTPYFQNGWYQAKVKMTENSKISNGLVAYDLVKNKVYFSIDSEKQAIEIDPYEFELNGHKFKKFSNQFVAAGNFYYEKLVEGETELFRQYSCNYSPTVSGDRTGYESSGNEFEGNFEKKETYFINYNEKMQKVGRKYKVFDRNEEKAKGFASRNDLSLTKLNDLAKIVKFINENPL